MPEKTEEEVRHRVRACRKSVRRSSAQGKGMPEKRKEKFVAVKEN